MNRTKIFFYILLLTFFYSKTLQANNDYFLQGKKLYNQKKFIESKYKFEKDIVFNPKNEKSYLYLAKIFKEQKNDTLEEQNLNTVILLNPINEEALFLLTLLQIKKSDYEKSKKLIETFDKVCVKICDKKNELNNKLKDLELK